MTTDSGVPTDDDAWRRPAAPPDAPDPAPPTGDGPQARPAAPAPTGTASAGTTPPESAFTGPPSPWARPAGPQPAPPPVPASNAPEPPAYAGPPPTAPPPRNWRPPLVVQPSAPRALPPQDLARLDLEERNARTFTLGVGMIAGAVTLIVICLLCSRLIF